MLPRSSIRPLARQLMASASKIRAPISTSAKKAFDYNKGAHDATRGLFDIDGGSSSSGANTSLSPTPPSTTTRGGRAAGPRPAVSSTSDDGGAAAMSQRLETGGGYARFSATKATILEGTREQMEREDLARQAPRVWREGDAYAPHDLSPSEMKKWQKMKASTRDVFDLVGINPLDHYKNFSIISEYMTEQGRIKTNKATGLRLVNQRKIAKAIRRAIGMGIHPSTHRHPEILFKDPLSGPRHQSDASNQDATENPSVSSD